MSTLAIVVFVALVGTQFVAGSNVASFAVVVEMCDDVRLAKCNASKTHRLRRSLWDSKSSPQNSLSIEPTLLCLVLG